MARRVLIISSNRCVAPEPVFPLGLSYLSAALRRAGYEVKWLDSLAGGPELREVLSSFKPDLAGISIRNIDDVCIQNRQTFYGEASRLCSIIKEHHACPVVLGGSGFSVFPAELLAGSQADFGIVGEGEDALIQLLHCLEQGADYKEIPALVYRAAGEVRVNPPRYCESFLELASEDRPPEIRDYYLRSSGVINLQTQRGCGFRCCYCTYPLIEGRARRTRSPQSVAAELELIAASSAKYAFIVDSVFNSTSAHVRQICEAILERGVRLSWGCFLRPRGITPELMELMARAGLSHVEFGCDSFCDEVLRSYQKGFGFEDIRKSVDAARLAGVDTCCFLIAGGLGETMETLDRSFQNAAALGHSTIMAAVGMRIYPGTALHRRALAEGVVRAESNLLEPHYYIAPGLDVGSIEGKLREFSRQAPNWILGDPNPEYFKLVERLRKRGVTGPLWSYFAAIQRVWPAQIGAS